jgi:hypothetical protein
VHDVELRAKPAMLAGQPLTFLLGREQVSLEPLVILDELEQLPLQRPEPCELIGPDRRLLELPHRQVIAEDPRELVLCKEAEVDQHTAEPWLAPAVPVLVIEGEIELGPGDETGLEQSVAESDRVAK